MPERRTKNKTLSDWATAAFMLIMTVRMVPYTIAQTTVRAKVFSFGGGLFFLAVALAMIEDYLPGWKRYLLNTAAISFVTSIVLLLGTWLSMPETWESAERSYRQAFQRYGILATLAFIFILALIGCILFLIKTHLLLFYAYIEIIFALTSCYVAVERSRKEGFTPNTLTVVVGAVYLVVRGLDNRRNGLKQPATGL